MQSRGHQLRDDSRIGKHELPCIGFAVGLEDHEAERLVQRLGRATGENDLSGLRGLGQALEMSRNDGILGVGPRTPRSLVLGRQSKDIYILPAHRIVLCEGLDLPQYRQNAASAVN